MAGKAWGRDGGKPIDTDWHAHRTDYLPTLWGAL
jgi:hypothetical protein